MLQNNQYEDPLNFFSRKKINDIEIVYSNLIEICQGGPEIGTIAMNNRSIERLFFGGPWITDRDFGHIYIPCVQSELGIKFKLAKIEVLTHNIQFIGDDKDLIFLDRVEGNIVFFYDSMEKANIQYCPIYDKQISCSNDRAKGFFPRWNSTLLISKGVV